MKRYSLISALALACLAIPALAHTFPIDMEVYGDCNMYGQRVIILRPWHICAMEYEGEGEWAWNEDGTGTLPAWTIRIGVSIAPNTCGKWYQINASEHTVYKSEFCQTPQPAHSIEWGAIIAGDDYWCGTYTQYATGDKADAVCFNEPLPDGVDGVCLENNRYTYPSCQLSNYNVSVLGKEYR